MIDKIRPVARDKLRGKCGSIANEQLIEVERALAVWLGMAD
jgi:mRNA-degrading endonuclease toxin of MazEF toxin-antitoxin module